MILIITVISFTIVNLVIIISICGRRFLFFLLFLSVLNRNFKSKDQIHNLIEIASKMESNSLLNLRLQLLNISSILFRKDQIHNPLSLRPHSLLFNSTNRADPARQIDLTGHRDLPDSWFVQRQRDESTSDGHTSRRAIFPYLNLREI